MTTQLWEKLRF